MPALLLRPERLKRTAGADRYGPGTMVQRRTVGWGASESGSHKAQNAQPAGQRRAKRHAPGDARGAFYRRHVHQLDQADRAVGCNSLLAASDRMVPWSPALQSIRPIPMNMHPSSGTCISEVNVCLWVPRAEDLKAVYSPSLTVALVIIFREMESASAAGGVFGSSCKARSSKAMARG